VACLDMFGTLTLCLVAMFDVCTTTLA